VQNKDAWNSAGCNIIAWQVSQHPKSVTTGTRWTI